MKTFKEVVEVIQDGDIWVNKEDEYIVKSIQCMDGELIIDLHGTRSTFGTKGLYELEKVEYSFLKALKALGNGAEIESSLSGWKYRSGNEESTIEVLDPEALYWQEWDKEEVAITIGEINSGWYIKGGM